MAQGTTKGVPIDIDPLLAADSDLLVPSQKAVKTYVTANALAFSSLSANAPLSYNNAGVFSISQASGSTNGYLSSTDWSAFNSKISGSGTLNEIAYFSGTGTLSSLTTATYPSLTELSYVKGATSAIQTQLNNRTRIVLKNSTDASTSSLTNTLLYSGLIAANTFTTGDLIRIETTFRKTGTVNNYTFRIYINTSASLTGATQMGTRSPANNIPYGKIRRLATIKSATNTEIYPATVSQNVDYTESSTAAASTLNIDWTVAQYIIVSALVTNASDAAIFSSIIVEKI